MKKVISLLLFVAISVPVSFAADKESLGRSLFFDENLSLKRNQSCASCHNPEAGFVDNRDNGVESMASLGDDGQSLGDRIAPMAAYAQYSPDFHFNKKTKQYVGGQFWDGRAKDLATQAAGPPLNPGEMALPNKQVALERLKENPFYVNTFTALYGASVLQDSEAAYDAMTDSIAAFERSDFFAPFDSKYDRYLAGEYELTAQEELGMSLFFSNNNTNCATCHVLKGEDKKGETFSNYEFHNIGVPVNTALRQRNGVAKDKVDVGLLDNPEVTDPQHAGKFKVPSLRNVALTGPYMHNGVFKELSTVMAFYDQYNNPQRSINPESGKAWQAPEVAATVNKKDLKARKLSDAKIAALVAFLHTLTDKRYEKLLQQQAKAAK